MFAYQAYEYQNQEIIGDEEFATFKQPDNEKQQEYVIPDDE